MRQFQIREFIESTIPQLLVSRGRIDARPLLMIDESMNNEEFVGACARRLLQRGAITGSSPAFYKKRATEDGTVLSVLGGSVTPSPLVPDTGREVRGASWPDEGVVAALITALTHVDRVCLLTKDTGRNVGGIHHILMYEVLPAISRLVPERLGVLVLAQTPGLNDLRSYAQAVDEWLTRCGVKVGVHWEELPKAHATA